MTLNNQNTPPGLIRRAWNLAEAISAFVVDGMKTVTKEQYEKRLQTCDVCDRRQGGQCLECGCRIALKARARAMKCPLDKWPEV